MKAKEYIRKFVEIRQLPEQERWESWRDLSLDLHLECQKILTDRLKYQSQMPQTYMQALQQEASNGRAFREASVKFNSVAHGVAQALPDLSELERFPLVVGGLILLKVQQLERDVLRGRIGKVMGLSILTIYQSYLDEMPRSELMEQFFSKTKTAISEVTSSG